MPYPATYPINLYYSKKLVVVVVEAMPYPQPNRPDRDDLDRLSASTPPR
jgi:hypothetical protein